MIAELESIAEGRAWAFRGRRPIGIVRLRWSKPAIAGLDPQQSASRHQLLEFTERRRHRQRIATCDGVPEATLIIVTGAVEDSSKLRLALALAANDPLHRTGELDPCASPGDRINTHAGAGPASHFPRLTS